MDEISGDNLLITGFGIGSDGGPVRLEPVEEEYII